MDEVPAGGAPTSPQQQSWEAAAFLAVTSSLVAALPLRARRTVRRRLAAITSDWERDTEDVEGPAVRAAARRVLQPLVEHLEREEAAMK